MKGTRSTCHMFSVPAVSVMALELDLGQHKIQHKFGKENKSFSRLYFYLTFSYSVFQVSDNGLIVILSGLLIMG